MQELEKILEEIEKLKDMYEESAFSLIDKGNLPCEYDKSDIESAKMQAISEAITIIRNHMNDGWIPVEEGLPEDTESGFYNAVNVTMSNGSVTHGCYRNADGEWWVAMEDGEFKYTRSDEVIAWSPLPESYCPERSDNHDRE